MRLLARIDPTTDRTAEVRTLLAASSIAAGVIHAWAVPDHLREEWVFGAFFVLAASFQILWAIRVVFGPSAIVFATGALANGALIGLWIVSRTIGLPIGPHTWMPEPARAPDGTATVLEMLLVAGSLALVRRRAHAELDTGHDRLGKEPQLCA